MYRCPYCNAWDKALDGAKNICDECDMVFEHLERGVPNAFDPEPKWTAPVAGFYSQGGATPERLEKGEVPNNARAIGLKAIDDAEWQMDEHNTLNLFVNDADNRKIWCWINLRPQYCDRGHLELHIVGLKDLDGQDAFPRYFFSADEAKTHAKTFLKWRLWRHRTHPHTL